MHKTIMLSAGLVLLWTGQNASAMEIGFSEDFALATNRAAVLGQLIPGTEDYYFYTCLNCQNQGQLDKVEETLKPWLARQGETPRNREIRNRQALLGYTKNPQATLAYLKLNMGLLFDHQQEQFGKKSTLPTRLDQAKIGREALTARALAEGTNTVNQFEDSAFDFLASMNLDGERRRDFLRRIRRPVYPNLVRIIAADLNLAPPQPFGSLRIHSDLLLSQLDELLILKPDLLHDTHFINSYLTKLRPGADVDWQRDATAREAFLDRQWNFVKKLAPAHNSLKLNILYQRLAHDRALGKYDKARFMEYISIPRSASYVNPKYLESPSSRDNQAKFGADFSVSTLMPAVAGDEALVRDYLEHFFLTEESYLPYQEYLLDTYLRDVFATTKILNGVGDMEKWYSLLNDPEKYQALKERVEIEFAPANKTLFRLADPVVLEADIKNVKTLFVKVFEINTVNYYRDHLAPITTAIDLDGLVAGREEVKTYDDPPLRRIRRKFEFPDINRSGVFVVEFIGNGKSSRALVRKGDFRILQRVGAAGHVFTILDEQNRKVNSAAIWLAGHEYQADTNGLIALPFSTKPGRQPIVVSQVGFATLDQFEHQAETYALSAGVYVDREALLKGNTARVILRPLLTVNDNPISLSLLEDPHLVIESTDTEGIKTVKEVRNLKLSAEQEYIYEFQVPENLIQLSFTLKGKVQNMSRNQKDDVAANHVFSFNQMESTANIESLHLSRVPEGYILRLLGKNGEPKSERPVKVELKHRDFVSPVKVSLQTDNEGRIALGALNDITTVKAAGPEDVTNTWILPRDCCAWPPTIHVRVGEKLSVPYMGAAARCSLLGTCGGTYVKDWSDSLAITNGFLTITGLPMGTFELWLKEGDQAIVLQVTEGDVRDGYIMGANRLLEIKNPAPLQIGSIHAEGGQVTIALHNATPLTRVHVAASRFMPAYSLFDSFNLRASVAPQSIYPGHPESCYVSGRDIGDEYRYILERKYAPKFPGNMLTRPSLLLNPWVVQTTENETESLLGGSQYSRLQNVAKFSSTWAVTGSSTNIKSDNAFFANLDFLAEPAVLLANLKPDADGVVTIPRKALGPGQQVRVLALNANNAVYRELILPEAPPATRDLRLASALDPEKHFTEQKQVSAVTAGRDFVIPDNASSKLEYYDTLPKVYGLYVTLSGDATLQEFGFINDWPQLKPEQKREKYAKYACHELNFFLYKKDRDFFDKVIQPYLRHKLDKTFMDRWLIGEDLSAWLKPWPYDQLNIFERILLAQRINGEQAPTIRHLKDLQDLMPPDLDRLDTLFTTAINGSALETRDGIGGMTSGVMEAIPAAGAGERLGVSQAVRSKEHTFVVSVPPKAPPPPPTPARTPETQKELTDKTEGSRKDLKTDTREKSHPVSTGAEPNARNVIAGAEALEIGFVAGDVSRRKAVRQLYRQVEQTREWAENNYYHEPVEDPNAGLVEMNPFWLDYARHGAGPFLSTHLAEVGQNFTELLLALAVLDLPFEAPPVESAVKGASLTLKSAQPLVVFHKEIRETAPATNAPPITISQNYFRASDRYRTENGEQFDKFVTDEFLAQVVYGCQVVLTDPASAPEKLDVLLQIPKGALPVQDGFYTRSRPVRLEPFSTLKLEYYFYFPQAGEYPHFPAHAARKEQLVAAAPPKVLKVVATPTRIDTSCWDYVSQNGTPEAVLAYLNNANPVQLNLERIAWRMRDKDFFNKTTDLLARRHCYNHVLWSYGIVHNNPAAIREFLQNADDFLDQCGRYLDCELVTLDPVVRKSYQHLEYSPLVNARAHPVGKRRQIFNERQANQYLSLLDVLSYRPQLDQDDLLSVTYHLLLQDRIDEAGRFFARVDPKQSAARLQYDYLRAYLDFYTPDHQQARRIAETYRDYPVERWRNLFAGVLAQLDELDGKGPALVDKENRDQQQTQLAGTEASFEFAVESRKVTVTCQNLKEAAVNYYKMDIELLFSRNPFIQQQAGQFAYIQPNRTDTLKFPDNGKPLTFDLPDEFRNANVMVEIVAGGVKKSHPYFANSLALQIIENYGQLKVTHQKSGAPLAQVYVKVFVRLKNGEVKFYKDGYTDLRGRFDYASLNTNEIEQADKFALLIMSETDGAVIREANPPKQ